MPTRQSSLFNRTEKYMTYDFCSNYLTEGMLERLDAWSEYQEFQRGCWELIQVFSTWETSKDIRENPEEWGCLAGNTLERFELRQSEEFQKLTNAVKNLNTLISQMQAETEINWKAINRDRDFYLKEENK